MLLFHDTGIDYGAGGVWGDKRLSYTGHIKLLKDLFPDARILYVVWGVRDYCVSMCRAWGKNMAASCPKMDASPQIERDRSQFPHDILRSRYEDLMVIAEKELRRKCLFLVMEYEALMHSLISSVENLGDTKGFRGEKPDSAKKYMAEITWSMLLRIESLCWSILKELNSPYKYEWELQRLSHTKMRVLQNQNSINFARIYIRAQGFVKNFAVFLGLYSKSGNKQTS